MQEQWRIFVDEKTIKNEENKQAEEVREELDKEREIPSGYITMKLSTEGRFGAPAVFHIRNFITEDLVKLALEDDDKVQLKVVDMLQGLIYEPKEQVDIMKFHEKEVIEMLLRLYKTFYQTKLNNLTWELTPEDEDFIAREEGGKDTDAYRRRIAAIKRGDEKREFSIDLNTVQFYPVPEDITDVAEYEDTDPATGKKFTVQYTFPRYGDSLLLKNFMFSMPKFKDGEKRFASIRENVKFRQRMEEQWKSDPSIPLERVPRFQEQDMDKFREYETEKAVFATRAVKALHLKSIDGQDISNLPLDQKLQYADDPRLSHAVFEQINKLYEGLKIGVKEDIKVVDPYLNKVVEIKYPFRLLTILQAIRDNKPDGAVIKFIKRN